jgi:hypothetical protein
MSLTLRGLRPVSLRWPGTAEKPATSGWNPGWLNQPTNTALCGASRTGGRRGVFGKSQGQVHPSDRMEKSMRSGSGDVSRNMNAAPLLRLRAQTGGEYIYAIDMTILTSRYEKELIVSN